MTRPEEYMMAKHATNPGPLRPTAEELAEYRAWIEGGLDEESPTEALIGLLAEVDARGVEIEEVMRAHMRTVAILDGVSKMLRETVPGLDVTIPDGAQTLARALRDERDTLAAEEAEWSEAVSAALGGWDGDRGTAIKMLGDLSTRADAAEQERDTLAAALERLREAANALCDGAESFTVDEDGNEAGHLDGAGMEGLREAGGRFYDHHYASTPDALVDVQRKEWMARGIEHLASLTHTGAGMAEWLREQATKLRKR